MKGLKLLSSVLLVSSISATALPVKDESVGNISRWLLAKSVQAYEQGNSKLGMKFTKYSCGLGNRDACLFTAEITVKEMMHKSLHTSILTPRGTLQLLNTIHYELKSCKLGNPYACHAFAEEMQYLNKDKNIKIARKFANDKDYQHKFVEAEIQICKTKGQKHCTRKATTTLANLVTLSRIIVTNQNTVDDYQQLACKLVKTYKIRPLKDASPEDVTYYNKFIAFMNHYIDHLKQICIGQK